VYITFVSYERNVHCVTTLPHNVTVVNMLVYNTLNRTAYSILLFMSSSCNALTARGQDDASFEGAFLVHRCVFVW